MFSTSLFWQCRLVFNHISFSFPSLFPNYESMTPSHSIPTLWLQPRMLLTVDENLKPLSVPVRVGQAVDVVGQAGRPKTITGFQTHSTPVLLAAGDRAELATEKYELFNLIIIGLVSMVESLLKSCFFLYRYIPLSPILEGFVILKENPDYREDN